MRLKLSIALITLLSIQSFSFCGFYVAQAGARLFNNKSEVILVRDGNRTTITMSNDFDGDVKDFAMVIPIPNVIERSDIQIVDRSLFSLLDNYSAPRLVEYFDANPCAPVYDYYTRKVTAEVPTEEITDDLEIAEFEENGVTIEAQYEVDEYEILILSAEQSTGLKAWLIKNGYNIPSQAEEVLDPYIKDGLKFFVVKVNLEKYNPKANGGYLRPIQLTVESSRFTLPIRLGMANSEGEQDMIVYAFTKSGRIESTNYRTQKLPSNMEVPTFVQQKFDKFYKALFKTAYEKGGRNSVFLEYAWNVTPSWGGMKCDPCTGSPPYFADLSLAGVNWLNTGTPVFFTRLHVRYSRDKFPEDLQFQVTPNSEHFQGRYIITHAATGNTQCDEAAGYWKKVRKRRQDELLNMASLTGWDATRHTDYIYSGHTNKKVQPRQGGVVSIPVKKQAIPYLFLSLTTSLLLMFIIKRIKP